MSRTFARRGAVLGAVLGPLLLLVSSGAVADDLPPPPEQCPPGSTPHSEHAGQWCAATTCESDADCTAEAQRRQGVDLYHDEPHVCREVSLCALHETYQLGGLRPEPRSAERDVATGACVGGSTCPRGGECTTRRRCVRAAGAPATAPPTSDTPPASSGEQASDEPESRSTESADEGGGGCASAPGASGSVWPLLLALGLLIRRRR